MKKISFIILSLIGGQLTFAQSKPVTEITRQANEKLLFDKFQIMFPIVTP
jgi:hypothetical protein